MKTWNVRYRDKRGVARTLQVEAESHKAAERNLQAAIVRWYRDNTRPDASLPPGYEPENVLKIRVCK